MNCVSDAAFSHPTVIALGPVRPHESVGFCATRPSPRAPSSLPIAARNHRIAERSHIPHHNATWAYGIVLMPAGAQIHIKLPPLRADAAAASENTTMH